MELVLSFNGVHMPFDVDTIGPRIIDLAQGRLDEAELGTWLRGQVS